MTLGPAAAETLGMNRLLLGLACCSLIVAAPVPGRADGGGQVIDMGQPTPGPQKPKPKPSASAAPAPPAAALKGADTLLHNALALLGKRLEGVCVEITLIEEGAAPGKVSADGYCDEW